VAASSGGQRSGTGKRVRPRRDMQALKDRRMVAADMFARGKRQVDVVSELEVSAQTASRWYRAWRDGGRAALAGVVGPDGCASCPMSNWGRSKLRWRKARGPMASRPSCGPWPGWPR
jgi:hypothetical protein